MQVKTLGNIQGVLAVLIWSFSALYILWTQPLPPFQVAALSSAAAVALYLPLWLSRPGRVRALFVQPRVVWPVFIISVILYRPFQLSGLKLAPIVEANLLNFLWPLMIVLLDAPLDGKKIPRGALIGAVLSLAGVACIGAGKADYAFSFGLGHAFAFIGAVLWAIYSLMTRRLPASMPDTGGIVHILAVPLFLLLSAQFETPVALGDLTLWQWAGVMGLGLSISWGFYLWDRGMTFGDSAKIAVFAYFAPLLSTLWLVLFAGQTMTPWLWAAAGLIISGSVAARRARG